MLVVVTFPALSRVATVTLWGPFDAAVVSQLAAYGAGPVSSRPRSTSSILNCTPPIPFWSLTSAPRLTTPETTASAVGEVIDATGGVESLVQVTAAGLPSTLPAASVARTEKVWLPSFSPLRSVGELQLA